jgi:hypothetical protein
MKKKKKGIECDRIREIGPHNVGEGRKKKTQKMIKGTLVMLAQSCPSMIASASLLKALLKIFFFFLKTNIVSRKLIKNDTV